MIPEEISQTFTDRGCELLSDHIPNKSVLIDYICACGVQKKKMYKDFVRRGCRTCNNKKLKEIPTINIKSTKDEEWKPVTGGWISSLGQAKNAHGKPLTLCPTKYRYRLNGKHHYASRLVAEAFQLEGYKNLNNQRYVVSHKNDNPMDNRLENLVIKQKCELGAKSGTKSRQSDTFQKKLNWTEDKFQELEFVVVPELPSHKIYSNGEIWNGKRFLTFSKSGKYYSLCLSSATYKVHRLVCYAFHKINGKTTLEDYKDLQVNHKDGNTYNNSVANLEWCSQSENMFHSYETKLNKKTRYIIQKSLAGEYITEYSSIAKASRQSGEPEHRIREIAKGRQNNAARFLWEFKNPDETQEYSKKFINNPHTFTPT